MARDIRVAAGRILPVLVVLVGSVSAFGQEHAALATPQNLTTPAVEQSQTAPATPQGQTVPTTQSQTASAAATKSYSLASEQVGRLMCPGEFPTDLTVTNCSYRGSQRLQQWVTTSFTDQAMLGAVVYGLGAQIIKSPDEWGRTWGGYGDRIGVRYVQGAARGSAEYVVGAIMRDDPRHLSYKEDPHTHYGNKILSTKTAPCRAGEPIQTRSYGVPSHLVWRRIGHAFFDSVTVLKSDPCGTGRRLPAIDRLVGVTASAYGAYWWYPGAENTFPKVAERAAGAYGSTLVGSFYTEFSPEISLLLSRITAPKKKQP